MVSQAWGQEWTKCTGEYAGYCKWSATSCVEISSGPPPDGKSTCAEAYKNCQDYGGVYSDAACTQPVGTPILSCGYDCDWGAGGCWQIKTNPTGANNSAVTTTCEEAIANCDKDGKRYSSSDNTCSGTQIGGSGCNKWCKWDTGCVEIKADPNGDYGTATADCTEAIANCQAHGQVFNSQSECSSGGTPPTDPIISIGRSVGLTIVPNGNVLHIISDKAATVELFSMTGAKVFSSKVAAGNSSLSLGNQKTGVYYAVVKSGSQKQTVKVILK